MLTNSSGRCLLVSQTVTAGKKLSVDVVVVSVVTKVVALGRKKTLEAIIPFKLISSCADQAAALEVTVKFFFVGCQL